MNRKILKMLKLVTCFCVCFLIVEICYVGYSILNNKESLYFDGVNSITSNDNYFYAVGSNNNNDNKFEKAILTSYNMNKEKKFEKIYNKGFNSAFFDVEIDSDSIVAVGSYEDDEKSHKDLVRKALFVKYDLDGNIIFERDFTLLDNSKYTSINIVDDGYLLTGQSVYKSTKIGSNDGGAILAKYDKDGNFIWSKTYGNNKTAIFNDLVVIDGYIYVVGVDENYLGVICKYDLDGNFVASNDYRWTDSIGFSDICNINNRIFVCGANKSGDNWTNSMIVEYDEDCNYVNETIFEGEGINRYNRIMVDSQDNIIAIGSMKLKKKSSDKTADVFNYDAIIGKYSGSLDKVSVVTYGDEKDDFFTDITFTNNNYLVSGYSSYEDGSYLSKFLRYSTALKLLGVE